MKQDSAFDSLFVVDDGNAFLKQKSGAERMQIAFSINESLRKMITDYLRYHNPEWDEPRIRKEVARRFSYADSKP
jgi:hypothetical protein